MHIEKIWPDFDLHFNLNYILVGSVLTLPPFGRMSMIPPCCQYSIASFVSHLFFLFSATFHQWPSGEMASVPVAKCAFVYTSFIDSSLMSICAAGFVLNFVTGLAWGIFIKWLDRGPDNGNWTSFSSGEIATIVLAYDLSKGGLQWFFGSLSDKYGRRPFIIGGLFMCSVGLVSLLVVNAFVNTKTQAEPGFIFGAIVVGVGTSMAYATNIAAVSDHCDPTFRSSAIGAYRFWRDIGIAVGALATSALSDNFGYENSLLVSAFLVFATSVVVYCMYEERLARDRLTRANDWSVTDISKEEANDANEDFKAGVREISNAASNSSFYTVTDSERGGSKNAVGGGVNVPEHKVPLLSLLS